MRTPEELPSDLPSYFSVTDARERGLGWARVRRSDLRAPYSGIRARIVDPVGTSLSERCAEYAPRLADWQFFSHETALGLHGAPMPEWPYRPELHVSAHRPTREPRVPGIRGHRLQLREPATQAGIRGLPVEHPVRAWRQAGTTWRLDDLIAAGDYLVSGARPLASIAELAEEIEVMGDLRSRLLSRALSEIRVGVRSARETKLRLVLVRGGLPVPEVNWVLRDRAGRAVAELDLAFPRWRVAAEYDGRVHEMDSSQFAKDSDRWDRVRAQGWQHVRVMNHHMSGGAQLAVAKVRRALVDAGWRPGH
ncbi:hypothetical protein [Microbacterium sp. cx-59]|uniref:hypothetical protein n=1 Tax=Microbacterium sp. cx-59 TaxID=2891207 RepID=UPI001E50382C|nr:hypothetical protein [Microbacterium sp. cx-59]MCC4909705.1 hypothetical protein [Microbacterium sp. cx-59]